MRVCLEDNIPSMEAIMTETPSMTATEELAARGATAPRVTLEAIKHNIGSVRYLIPGAVVDMADDQHPLHRMTLCFVTTLSGFVFIGKSAPISAANFDAEKGRTFAYEDALRQMWPMMAFMQLEADYWGLRGNEDTGSASR